MTFVALGLPEEELERSVQRIAEIQLITGAFRPLFLVDTPHFAVLRRFSFPFEFVIPEDEWERSGQVVPWTDHLLRRTQEVVQSWGVTSIVPLSRDGLSGHSYEVLLSLGALPR